MIKNKFLYFIYTVLLFFVIIPFTFAILVCCMPIVSIAGFLTFITDILRK